MSAAVQIVEPETEVRAAMRAIGAQARSAARVLANAQAGQKNRALEAAAYANDRTAFSTPTRAISPTARLWGWRRRFSTVSR